MSFASPCLSCSSLPPTQGNNAHPHHAQHRERDREHRRDRDHAHRRTPRPLQDGGSPSGPLVLSPTTAHVKSSSRRHEREQRERERERERERAVAAAAASRDASIQALAPAVRRSSQLHGSTTAVNSAQLNAPHPYAATPSPTSGYRPGGPYGRHSPGGPGSHPVTNGSVTALNHHGHANGSGSFMYGSPVPPGKNGTESTANGGPVTKDAMGIRNMSVYDRDQMRRMGRQDDDVGRSGRNPGLWDIFCCRT